MRVFALRSLSIIYKYSQPVLYNINRNNSFATLDHTSGRAEITTHEMDNNYY